MPHVRNYRYRKVKCPMCQKTLNVKEDDNWFCSKACEEEWKILNGDLKPSPMKHIRGRDTSS